MPHWTEIRPNRSYHMLIITRTSQIKANSLHLTDFILVGSRITVDGDCSHEIKRHLLLGRKAMKNLDSILKKQRHHFADKNPYSQSYSFSSNHVQIWELGHKDGWVPRNWRFWIAVLKTIESPLDGKDIKPILKETNPEYWKNWCWN